MAFWSNYYKIWTYALGKDPFSNAQPSPQQLIGAGVTMPEAVPDLRQDGSANIGNRTHLALRDSNDFIDLTSVTNRQSRYKEYERLRSLPEIETVMTIISDEACVSGSTKLQSPFYGPKPIKWFEENKKDERFLLYCYDFNKNDYTLGWAYDPRFVKHAPTVKVMLDDGSSYVATPDHRALLRSGEWIASGDLKIGDKLMPFHRVKPDVYLNKSRTKQFPRIFTMDKGWIHERQFIDDWRHGQSMPHFREVNSIVRALAAGIGPKQLSHLFGAHRDSLMARIKKEGFSRQEVRHLGMVASLEKGNDYRRVIAVRPYHSMDVYDISVEQHKNFCTDSVVLHNCQRGENGNIGTVTVKNEEVKKECEKILFHRKYWNLNRTAWNHIKNLCIWGDEFLENIIDPENPQLGILRLAELPPESIYRLETVKGKLVEFQQSKEGPDYQSLTRTPVTRASEAELQQSTAIRFTPDQITHMKLGDNRKTFYPYGVSLIEPARGPAHQLRLMEDSMLVYRLSRAAERRIFYIDTGSLPSFKSEALVEKLQDQFKKKKVSSRSGTGANSVEERWHSPAVDEDIWIAIKPNSNSRVETLPGASNLGEIDDSLYFRKKLYVALNFPDNYFSSEDPNVTRITLSARDINFAKRIERIQSAYAEGVQQTLEKHLMLRGFPEDAFEDLIFEMSPPSDYRELSKAELVNHRIGVATQLKGANLISDFDALTKYLKYSEKEAKAMMARNQIQQLQLMKQQILLANPALLGIGGPSNDGTEIGADAGGPSPMLQPGQEQMPGADPQQMPGGEQQPMPGAEQQQLPAPEPAQNNAPQENSPALPDPELDDIKKYDLEIQNYSSEQDHEDIEY